VTIDGIAGPSDPRRCSIELLDGREPWVLDQHPIDLGILVVQCDREPDGHSPDSVILRAGQADRVGAPTIRALTEIDVDAFVQQRPVVGDLGPLIDLPEMVSFVASCSRQSGINIQISHEGLSRPGSFASDESAEHVGCIPIVQQALGMSDLEGAPCGSVRADQDHQPVPVRFGRDPMPEAELGAPTNR
jgi:hypothetical protein